MNYQYDIFISYRRLGATRKWINDIFKPMLEDIISLDLGKNPVLYLDDQLEAGAAWPLALSNALSSSKVLISLWSVTYLESEWCKCEISHMLARETKTGFKTAEKDFGLVFPTIINDGETIPISISLSQKAEIQNHYVPFMDLNSQSAADLYKVLRPFGLAVSKSIKNAPPWQNDWKIEAANDFYNLFAKNAGIQTTQMPKFITI